MHSPADDDRLHQHAALLVLQGAYPAALAAEDVRAELTRTTTPDDDVDRALRDLVSARVVRRDGTGAYLLERAAWHLLQLLEI